MSAVISKKIQKVLGGITETYPDLRVTRLPTAVEVVGSLPIINEGSLLDRFLIKLTVDPSYPRQIPSLFETGGRIPHTKERHISPGSGEACVCLRDEWPWIAPDCPTVLGFIRGPVTHFFIWQLCYQQFGKDRLGGWGHGGQGRLEFYQDRLGIDNLETIRSFLLHLAKPRFQANWLCYCGSGRKASKCHKGKIISFRTKISPGLATSALHDIMALKPPA